MKTIKTMKLKERLKKRIQAGIAFLNVKSPNWLKKIDLEKLDLNEPKLCILGEVYGDYHEAKEKLLANDKQIAEDLAFRTSANRYSLLTRLWKNELRKLL